MGCHSGQKADPHGVVDHLSRPASGWHWCQLARSHGGHWRRMLQFDQARAWHQTPPSMLFHPMSALTQRRLERYRVRRRKFDARRRATCSSTVAARWYLLTVKPFYALLWGSGKLAPVDRDFFFFPIFLSQQYHVLVSLAVFLSVCRAVRSVSFCFSFERANTRCKLLYMTH